MIGYKNDSMSRDVKASLFVLCPSDNANIDYRIFLLQVKIRALTTR